MNHHQNKQNQLGEKCLLVRQLHINNEITPAQFLNKNLQTQRDKEKQNQQIQEQLNKSQDNLSEVDIDHIRGQDDEGGEGDGFAGNDFDSGKFSGNNAPKVNTGASNINLGNGSKNISQNKKGQSCEGARDQHSTSS